MPGLTDPCAYCDYYAGLERAEADVAAPRTLAEITADALAANCGHCWAEPGRPCSCAPGTHLARFDRARRRGFLSAEDLAAVVAPLDVLTPGTVIRAEAEVPT